MKYVRAVTTDPLVTTHSLRHNLKDQLIRAQVQPMEQDLILGHANGGIGERVYGSMDARLTVTTEAMKAAWQVSTAV
jgi:integrase